MVVLSLTVSDHDTRLIPDEIIDKITSVLLLNGSGNSSLSRRTTYSGISGYASIDLSFHVSCTENFYGSDCGTLCVERDDALGHYNCSSEGELVCLAGYQNPLTNCTECVPALGCCKLMFSISVKNGVIHRPT